MLNKDNQRELAYVVAIDEIRPIPNYDRVEHARVGGWWVIVKKDQFKVGDPAIYIEVDSRVPEKEPFMFLEKRNFKVKTLKMCKVISQGLLMHPNDFEWKAFYNERDCQWDIWDDTSHLEIGDFVTEKLGIIYASDEDNKRKAASVDKYKKMAQRRPNLFKKPWAKWLMRREWGRRLMFFFFGKKKDNKGGWPAWVVKTDEERCQNMPWLFPSNPEETWIATEKVDGTSTTFTMKGYGRKREFYVCSRNVCFDRPDKGCYYETNVYTEMAEKYNIEEVLAKIMNAFDGDLEFVTLQGETYGEGIQRRDYGLKGHDFKAFNLIYGFKDGRVERLNPITMTKALSIYNIPCVDIVDEYFVIPSTCDELLEMAEGASAIDGGMREGLVFRSIDGARSFKAVSNPFLLKYHA